LYPEVTVILTPSATIRNPQLGAAWRMLLVTFLWGGFFLFGKIAVAEAAPMVVGFLRFACAGVVLAVLLSLREPHAWWPKGRDCAIAIGMGLTGGAIYNGLVFTAFKIAPASDGAMISPGLNPLLTTLFAAYFFGEPLGRRRLGAFALGLVGLTLIFYIPLTTAHTGAHRLSGDVLFILAAIVWSCNTLLGRAAAGRFSPLASTTYTTLFGLPLITLLAAQDLAQTPWLSLSGRFWLIIAVLGLACTVAAFFLFYDAIRLVGAGTAASYLLLIPVIGLALSILVLHEQPDITQVLGMVTTLCAVWIANHAPTPS
jgi:drug/metabolite transporter (DMT)-like permease